MKRHLLRILTVACAALLLPSFATAQFTFVGPSGGDFFDVLNWQDGGGFNPASIIDGGTSKVEIDLILDGDLVYATSEIPFGVGSLSLLSGSNLNVNSGGVSFDTGSLSLDGSQLNILNDSSSQLDMNPGSSFSLVDSFLVASDDIFFGGNASISGSRIVSVADDIEFQTGSVVSLLHDSSLTTADLNQIISFQSSATITDSTFSTGRLSIRTNTDLVAIDSVLNMNGDIDDAFNSFSNGTLTLQGNTALRADQLDEGITLYLEDESQASFIDDNAEGEWITDPGVAPFETKVVFKSRFAALSFVGPQGLSDDATQVFNGLSGTEFSYATHPHLFTPSNWNGQSTVTIMAVPEPSVAILASFAIASSLCLRRR
ncbi:hypothetical protein [Bythopirellula goksoeyrii]|uniref:PEP-CTERM protein-sorting domain-containing protein n=1 Tax=Bythopirellula goksoeyrii TaxID=1400387 RepID=A0A5B9QI74_9BACT|nr:hypothetical protein [Bythopirellula goksoeyrii]QEG36706.1 hypothetical protein Pr1d_40420 [Bythopirellula goksoeyrii]